MDMLLHFGEAGVHDDRAESVAEHATLLSGTVWYNVPWATAPRTLLILSRVELPQYQPNLLQVVGRFAISEASIEGVDNGRLRLGHGRRW